MGYSSKTIVGEKANPPNTGHRLIRSVHEFSPFLTSNHHLATRTSLKSTKIISSLCVALPSAKIGLDLGLGN